MARNYLTAGLVAALALAACGKSHEGEADAATTKKLAALRAHNDSMRTAAAAAAAAADSAARVRYSACSDSVTAVVAKAPARRKKSVGADSVATLVAGACGTLPVTATLAAATPVTARAAGAADSVRPDSSRAGAAGPDSLAAVAPAADSSSADSSGRGHETEVQREAFAYSGGTRDPFASLLKLKSAGPELGDLQLVAVYQDMRNNANSVAVLREKTTTHRHKVRVGDQLGRLQVRQIMRRDVVFNVEDFGYERQETLSLRKQEDVTP